MSSTDLAQPLVDPVQAIDNNDAGDDEVVRDDDSERQQQQHSNDGGHGSGASVLSTGLNMLNELEGAGILGLPYVLRLCGWASLVCLGAVGIMAGFTGYLLAMCMYAAGDRTKRVRSSYPAVGLAAFGKPGEMLVKIVQLANLVSVGVV